MLTMVFYVLGWYWPECSTDDRRADSRQKKDCRQNHQEPFRYLYRPVETTSGMFTNALQYTIEATIHLLVLFVFWISLD